MLTIILVLLTAYLIGSIPSAVLVCRLLRLPDPRQHGSNNPGTTNVLRIGGKKAAVITLITDALKGLLPVLSVPIIASDAMHTSGVVSMLAAWTLLFAFIGHLFPVFAKFQGGKGVATMLGGLFGLSLLVGFIAILTWVIIAAVTRYSSLAAMVAAVLTPIYIALFTSGLTWLPLVILSITLLWRHQHNIQRLVDGIESKIGDKT